MLPAEKAIAGLQGAVERLTEASRSDRAVLRAILRDGRMRDNAAYVHTYDTASTEESDPVDLVKEFGVPASGFRVHSVGAGTLQVAINGGKWVPVSAGDDFPDEVVRQVRLRCTTPGAGTAVLRFRAYVGPQ